MAELSRNILKQFASVVVEEKPTSNEQIVYGTVVEGGVQLDGSSMTTPVSTTSDILIGERVAVMIKDHQAVVLGNLTSPAARTDAVKEVGSKVAEFEKVVSDVVKTEQLDAQIARIDALVAEDVLINGKLSANTAAIDDLEAYDVEVKGKIEANDADISNLKTTKLDADTADIKYATIDNLKVTTQRVGDLEGDFGYFKTLTTNNFQAVNADINSLEADKLSANDIEGKYANIDFSNIDQATMKYFYAESGLINYITANGITTSYLEGVTIKGDLIEAGTLAADKLILKGTDGLYYELNTNGETIGSSQTEYNSLNGSVITKKSITADKITVTDLYAFGATIAGIHLTNNTLYSGVKSSINNTTKGFYLDNEGQMSLGDASNYLKYHKDSNGNYKLDISAQSITDASKTATNYLGFSNSGLVIGDLTANSLGNNVLIDSDSVDIRNGSTVLASYGANDIYLGKNSENTIIDLCSGSAQMYHYHDSSVESRFVIDSMQQVYINAGERVYLHSNYDNFEEYGYATIWVKSHDIPSSGQAIPNGAIRLEASTSYYESPTSSPTTRYSSVISMDPAYYTKLEHESENGIRSSLALVNNGLIEISSLNLNVDINELEFIGDVVLSTKTSAIFGVDNLGERSEMLSINKDNYTRLGYGSWKNGYGTTYICGNEIRLYTKNPSGDWKPYYSAGDNINVEWAGAGYLTTSSTKLYFSLPLAKPIVGNPTVTIENSTGMQLRQGGKYVCGCSSTTYVKPTYSASLLDGGNTIRIIATMSDTTNAVNNDVCGIYAYIKVKFS